MAPRTQVIHVNSNNRIRGTPYDFYINFGHALFQNAASATKITLEPIQAVINRSWYTVTALNNTFQVSDGSTVNTYEIPIGMYNVKTMLRTLQTLLSSWLLGWEEHTNRYFFRPPNDNKTYSLIFENYACFLLGFNIHTTVEASYNIPVYSEIPVKMSHESVVLIHTDLPRTRFSTVDNLANADMNESSVLVKIPIDKPYFDNLVWRSNSPGLYAFDLAAPYVDTLHVWITDEFNVPLEAKYDWTMSIKVTYHEEESTNQLILRQVNDIHDYLRLLVLEKTMKQQKKGKKSNQ